MYNGRVHKVCHLWVCGTGFQTVSVSGGFAQIIPALATNANVSLCLMPPGHVAIYKCIPTTVFNGAMIHYQQLSYLFLLRCKKSRWLWVFLFFVFSLKCWDIISLWFFYALCLCFSTTSPVVTSFVKCEQSIP